jgi:hypothetical protein
MGKKLFGGFLFFILFRAFFDHLSFAPIGSQKTNAAPRLVGQKLCQRQLL